MADQRTSGILEALTEYKSELRNIETATDARTSSISRVLETFYDVSLYRPASLDLLHGL